MNLTDKNGAGILDGESTCILQTLQSDLTVLLVLLNIWQILTLGNKLTKDLLTHNVPFRTSSLKLQLENHCNLTRSNFRSWNQCGMVCGWAHGAGPHGYILLLSRGSVSKFGLWTFTSTQKQVLFSKSVSSMRAYLNACSIYISTSW